MKIKAWALLDKSGNLLYPNRIFFDENDAMNEWEDYGILGDYVIPVWITDKEPEDEVS